MIVHDLDGIRSGVGPDEAHPPLIVDANAVLPFAIALQGFQSVRGRNSQVIEPRGRVEYGQLALGDDLDVDEAPDALTENSFSVSEQRKDLIM